jgi:hypothetical protein
MFKILVETRSILDILRKSIMTNLLSGAVVRLTEKGMITTSSFGTYGCFAEYKPEHFGKFLVDEQTDFCVTPVLVGNFEGMGFSSDEQCNIESDMPNNRLLVSAGSKRWMPNIPNPTIDTVGLPDSSIRLAPVDGVGYLPVTIRPILFQTKINVDKLALPRNAEYVSLNPSEKTLKLTWDMDGPAEMDIPLVPEDVSTPHTNTEKTIYTFHLSYLKNILAGLKGDITMTLYERSIVFNQIAPTYTLLYFIATI